MPMYYTENRLLSDDYRAKPAEKPNLVPAIVAVAAVILGAIGLVLAGPGCTPRQVRYATVRLEVDDHAGPIFGSGWIFNKRYVITTRDVAMPSGRQAGQYIVHIQRPGSADHREATYKDSGQPSRPGMESEKYGNWVVLSFPPDTEGFESLRPDYRRRAVKPGGQILVCGRIRGSVEGLGKLRAVSETVQALYDEGGTGRLLIVHGQPLDSEDDVDMLGGPVLDLWTGKVVGMSIQPPQTDEEARRAGYAFPIHLIDYVFQTLP